jgi:hypothetical protein
MPLFYDTTVEHQVVHVTNQKSDQQNKSCEATGDNVPS